MKISDEINPAGIFCGATTNPEWWETPVKVDEITK